MKLYINPTLEQTKDDNGIGRVVHAQHKYLPMLGFEIVKDFRHADLITSHVMAEGLPDIHVLGSHGVYWSDTPHVPFSNVNHEANARIAAAARRALAITVPSEWVSMIYRRDLRVTPTVIGHGIEPELWSTTSKREKPFLLWAKTRRDDVCLPDAAYYLAQKGAPVISTFLPRDKPPLDNFIVTGVMPHAQMQQLIEQSTVYLATTMETFGIQTLEALASGTPILGYAWGGTKDIVRHKVDGWLAEPNDLNGLVEGLQYILDHWPEMAQAARQRAEQYTWPAIMEQYAALYRNVAGEVKAENDRVSIVVTNYNYSAWVGQAIESVIAQLEDGDELIVIDDGSMDNSREVLNNLYPEHVGKHPSVKVVFTENHGVASARNLGISLALNPFIGCLDADDWYHPNFIKTLRTVLASDRALGVVFTGLEFYEGDKVVRTWNPPKEFDWDFQTRAVTPPEPPATMIPTPSACLFRKSMWTRAGGYKQVYAPGEDTEFMARGLSVGFTAQGVNSDARTRYRLHPGGASRTKKYDNPIHTWHPWFMDREFPFAAPISKGYPVARSYALPTVSVIIPVAAKHLPYLPGALDSLLGQTFRNWEVLVITDNCELTPDILTVYPFIRHYESKGKGVSEARNTGLDHASAPLTLFLDADDWLSPPALQKLVLKYSQSEGRYVYPDAVGIYQDGKQESLPFPEYDAPALFQTNLHAVTVLMATEQARILQFSPFMRGWEDWDFFLRAAIAGYHGVRLAEPLLFIRRDTGHFSEYTLDEKRKYKDEYIQQHYKEYQTGAKPMAGCCGGNAGAVLAAKNIFQNVSQEQGVPMSNGKVRMEFIGMERGAMTIHVNGRPYRGADSPLHKFADADPVDVSKLVATGKWRVVRSQTITPAKTVAPPSNPIIPFDWGKSTMSGVVEGTQSKPVQSKEVVVPGLDKMITTGFQETSPPGQLAVAPVFQDDYAVLNMTISDVKTAIGRGVDNVILLGWLQAEQGSEKPRTGVIGAIEKALER
jgi:glycosyltransferase involved in cell wall biosynthesis